MLELYQRVVINYDIPGASLKAGNLAWLIDYVPHPEGCEKGYMLEVASAVQK